MRLNWVVMGWAASALLRPAVCQTAYGLITGSVRDAVTRETVSPATIIYTDLNTGRTETTAAENGLFTFSSLSPGTYRLSATAAGYQDRLIEQLDLPVAGHFDVRFELWKLSDPWHSGAYRSVVMPGSQAVSSYYGPDIDSSRSDTFEPVNINTSRLETAVSVVVDSSEISQLPLSGRDVYTVLVLLPGVTADLATARGLGYSVNGQRPSSSNFLLDGLEYNDPLVTGPLGGVAPEFVQEYRISTSNFSPEYGRTSGFVANVVSHGGTNALHALLCGYVKNQLLDANGFQENANGYARAPLKEVEPGMVVTGPLLPGRIFGSVALDFRHFGSRNDPQLFALPTASFISKSDPSTPAGWLLHHYPAAVVPQSTGDFGLVTIAPPVTLDQAEGLARIDYLPGSGRHRLFWRALVSRSRTPDLIYNPYPQFSSPYHQGAASLALGWTWQLSTHTTNEVRIGLTGDSAKDDRPHTEVPQLAVLDESALNGTLAVTLPASRSSLTFRYVPRTWEAVDNWSRIQGRHYWTVGGGLLFRTIQSAFIADRDGSYAFQDLDSFVNGQPMSVLVAYDRAPSGYHPVPYNREYRYADLDFFAQDSFRASSRLALNYGVRYDYFSTPLNIGAAKDTLLSPDSGTFAFQTPAAGNQPLFHSERGDWSFRGGVSYDLTGRGSTVLRGSYGVFYDRPFDNLWETVSLNRQVAWNWSFSGAPVDFLQPVFSRLAAGTPYFYQTPFHTPTLFQENLPNPRVQTAFLGVQQRLGDSIILEANGIVSRGRRLWINDAINRDSAPPTTLGPGRDNIDPIGTINYRAAEGQSDYAAFTTAMRFRGSRVNGQVAYTWSHSIDNQSDPLLGFESFNTSREATASNATQLALFTVQGDVRVDRANSDFDQRQNLVSYAICRLPLGWMVSGIAAIRSGLPYTVFANTIIPNQRADLLLPGAAARRDPRTAVPGGEMLLNSYAFGQPQNGGPGTSGRNAFGGPGLISADLSAARGFRLPWLGEGGRFILRADFYNALNHANLNNPQAFLGAQHFGQALYGRVESNPGFPILVPLNETARQIQILLRIEF